MRRITKNLEEKNIEENNQKKSRAIIIVRIVSLIVILVCISFIIYRFFNLNKSKKVIDDINSEIEINDKPITIEGNTANIIDTNINSLKQKNKDTVAFIKVNGTNISYPVVQSTDNEYYLRHSFDNSYSQAGWIYMDYRNDVSLKDKNTIIYGHNMLNNTMFSELTKMLENTFFDIQDNNYINLCIENKSTLWKIFSVYVTNPDTYYMSINFASKNNYSEFLNNLKNKSFYNFNENVSNENKILTLSTCTNLNTKRLVVHAKLVYEEEN